MAIMTMIFWGESVDGVCQKAMRLGREQSDLISKKSCCNGERWTELGIWVFLRGRGEQAGYS